MRLLACMLCVVAIYGGCVADAGYNGPWFSRREHDIDLQEQHQRMITIENRLKALEQKMHNVCLSSKLYCE